MEITVTVWVKLILETIFEIRLIIAEEFYDISLFTLVKTFKCRDLWLKRLQLKYLIVCHSNDNYFKFNNYLFALKSEVESCMPWYWGTKELRGINVLPISDWKSSIHIQ